jgi:cell division protein FtsA
MNDIIVGLDIGTSKICAIIAKVEQATGIEILGVGKAPSMGLRKGEVTDVDRTTDALKDAVKQAEGTSGLEILRGFAGISGQGLETVIEDFEMGIADPSRGVGTMDVLNLSNESRKFSPPRGKRLIHTVPLEYLIDGHAIGLDPLDEKGERLKLRASIFTASVGHTEDMYRIVNGAQVEVMDILPNPLASAESVLEDSEKSIGCLLIDIGGGTTEAVVFRRGTAHYACVTGLGGEHFDSDLAHGLGISLREAERIKINFGSVKPEDQASDEVIEIAQSNGSSEFIPVKIIAEILGARLEEIIELTGEKLHHAGEFHGLKGGVVLTGGSSLLQGSPDKTAEILGLPARVGYPQRMAGLSNDVRNPIYATGTGLIKLGYKRYLQLSQGSGGGMFGDLKRRVVGSGIWKTITR